MLRRALRHAFTILSALSLLLCVAVCVLWVRSYHWMESFNVGPCTYAGGDGTVWLGFNRTMSGVEWTVGPVEWAMNQPRFQLGTGRGWWVYSLPHWLPATALLLACVLFIQPAFRTRSRGHRGLCATCGYDLRAHTAGDRCPECGTPVQSAA